MYIYITKPRQSQEKNIKKYKVIHFPEGCHLGNEWALHIERNWISGQGPPKDGIVKARGF